MSRPLSSISLVEHGGAPRANANERLDKDPCEFLVQICFSMLSVDVRVYLVLFGCGSFRLEGFVKLPYKSELHLL